MKHTITALSILIFSVVNVSCRKESNPAFATDIAGTYNFISLQAKTKSTIQSGSGSENVRTVTTSDYTTQKNGGTLTIDAGSFTSSDVTYSVNTVATSVYYQNGVLMETYSVPMEFTLPASSGTSTYQRITADSIYSSSGSLSMGASGMPPQPSGAKIKVENGYLIITSNLLQTSTTTSQGTTFTTLAEGTSVVTLQKK